MANCGIGSTSKSGGNPSVGVLGYNTPIAPQDKVQFYANLSELEDNANFSSWVVHLVHNDTYAISYPSVFTLSKDIISGTDYKFYVAPWTVQSNIPVGCHRLVIIDGTDGNILYISNTIEVMTLAEAQNETIFVRYRNSKNIQNHNYETLTTFYNVHRVRMDTIQPQRVVTSEGYQKINGDFERVRTAYTKQVNFVTGWFDIEGHDAFETATIHSDFQIWQNNQWNAYTRQDSAAYEQDFQEDYPVIQGSIKLDKVAYASTNKAL